VGLFPAGSGRTAGSDKRRFGNGKRCPGSRGRQRSGSGLACRAVPGRHQPQGTDVHKQDRRDRTIPAAVIAVVLFVAILVAALIWLAAS
jgi:hypothetical protein